MSWFKKIYGSQYEFSSPSSSQSSSQEPKVCYVKEKSKTDGNNTEIENLSIEENYECDETTQSTQDTYYSWSSISQEIDINGKKRELSDEEDEPWCESFKSQSTQKSTQESPQLRVFPNLVVRNLAVRNLKQRLVHCKMTIKAITKRKKTKTRKLVFT